MSVPGAFGREALGRIRAHFWLKLFGISAFMTLFFRGYFATLEHPFRPVTRMAAGPLDRLIPFQPWSVPLYCTLWVYVTLPPALLKSRRELWRFAAEAAALASAGLAIFALWPTAVALQGTGFLKTVDRSGNACPSLHAGFAVFTAVTLHLILRRMGASVWLRAINGLWCAAILYSALATKQHVTTDLIAGCVLGLAVAALELIH